MSIGFNGSVAGEGTINVDGVPKLKIDAAGDVTLLKSPSSKLVSEAALKAMPFAQAKMAANLSLPGGTITLVPFATEEVDLASNWDGDKFTATVPGWYLVNYRVFFFTGAALSTLTDIYTGVFKNGVESFAGGRAVKNPQAVPLGEGLVGGGAVHLNAAEYLDVRAYSSLAGVFVQAPMSHVTVALMRAD